MLKTRRSRITLVVIVGLFGLGLTVLLRSGPINIYINPEAPDSQTPVFVLEHHLVENFAAAADIKNYQPAAEIEALIDRMDLTPAGRQLFLSSKPTLEAEIDCGGFASAAGCFTSWAGGSTTRITILVDQTPRRLVEVAAHELIHSIYSQLTDDQKTELHPLLDQAHLDNQEYLDLRLANYGQMTDRQRYTETFAYLGSGVTILPAGLENHLGLYFNDRSKIVDPNPEPLIASRPQPAPPLAAPTPDPEPEPPQPEPTIPQREPPFAEIPQYPKFKGSITAPSGDRFEFFTFSRYETDHQLVITALKDSDGEFIDWETTKRSSRRGEDGATFRPSPPTEAEWHRINDRHLELLKGRNL